MKYVRDLARENPQGVTGVISLVSWEQQVGMRESLQDGRDLAENKKTAGCSAHAVPL